MNGLTLFSPLKVLWLRALCCCAGVAGLLTLAGIFALAQAPLQIRAKITVADDCTAFAWAPDGRLAYSTKHVLETKRLDIERDDVWILEKNGARRKIFSGKKSIAKAVRSVTRSRDCVGRPTGHVSRRNCM